MPRPSGTGPGRRVSRGPQFFVQLPLSALVLDWLLRSTGSVVRGSGRLLGRGVSGLLRRLWLLWALVGVVAAGWFASVYGPWRLLLVLAGVGALVVVVRLVAPGVFRSQLVEPLVGGWRRRRVYGPVWGSAMAACGLSTRFDGTDHCPVLVGVRSSRGVDRVRVRMLPGQVIGDFVDVADRVAQSFGAVDARVRSVQGRPNELEVWLVSRDPLASTVAPFPAVPGVDLGRVPVGLREDGPVFGLRLLGSHLLLVGATGAGKSSVVWSLLHALAHRIRDGLVAVWVIDPKGGMELAGGQALFARFCHGDTAGLGSGPAAHEHAYAELLEEAVQLMRTRQAKLRGVSRLHEPTPGEPLVLVVIDELASLTSYVTDRDAKRRIAAALSLLLSQGRAVGVTVVAALQDPRKEVLPARDLFPTRIGLRLVDADQVDMVLGDGARRRGARCDRIPESLPGVGYVAVDGVPEPVRVRFCYLDDTAITQLATHYQPGVTADAGSDDGPGSAGSVGSGDAA